MASATVWIRRIPGVVDSTDLSFLLQECKGRCGPSHTVPSHTVVRSSYDPKTGEAFVVLQSADEARCVVRHNQNLNLKLPGGAEHRLILEVWKKDRVPQSNNLHPDPRSAAGPGSAPGAAGLGVPSPGFGLASGSGAVHLQAMRDQRVREQKRSEEDRSRRAADRYMDDRRDVRTLAQYNNSRAGTATTAPYGDACFVCGGVGHKARQCPSAAPGDRRVKRCFECGQPGHFGRECPRRTGVPTEAVPGQTGRHRPETGHYRPETGRHHPETGRHHPETGRHHPETGHHRPEAGHHRHHKPSRRSPSPQLRSNNDAKRQNSAATSATAATASPATAATEGKGKSAESTQERKSRRRRSRSPSVDRSRSRSHSHSHNRTRTHSRSRSRDRNQAASSAATAATANAAAPHPHPKTKSKSSAAEIGAKHTVTIKPSIPTAAVVLSKSSLEDGEDVDDPDAAPQPPQPPQTQNQPAAGAATAPPPLSALPASDPDAIVDVVGTSSSSAVPTA